MSTFARISALDGVRGLATLMVLCSHFLFEDVWHDCWWWGVAHSGWMGVDLFFVLSGFLITGILLDSRQKSGYFSNFYRRRVLRIFPLYYFALLLSIFAIVVIDRMPERVFQGYDSLVWFFAFIPNVALALKGDWVWQTNWVGLSHLWSLAVEEQFYIVWPLLVFLLPRRVLGIFSGILLVAGVYLRMWTDSMFGEWSIASYVLPYCRMDGLAAGSLLAVLVRGKALQLEGWQRELGRDLTFLAGMILLYFVVAGNSHWRGTVMALFFMGFTYLALCSEGRVRQICETAFLRHIGKYSYALYVFHQMFRMVYGWYLREPLQATGWPAEVVQLLYQILAFGATYGLARLSWRFLEKPFLDMKG